VEFMNWTPKSCTQRSNAALLSLISLLSDPRFQSWSQTSESPFNQLRRRLRASKTRHDANVRTRGTTTQYHRDLTAGVSR
jgi:hypothetical protein